MLINCTNTGNGGRLYNRIRYLKKLQKNVQNQASSPLSQTVDPELSMNHMLWLKTVVVSDNNIEEIRTKLELTRARRDEIVLNDMVELMQEFPFFFTHPQLVSHNKFFYYDFNCLQFVF